ncbi:MAG: hypothetical protein HFE80_11985 [Clostridiaceae bacterium]|jgi:hypothetical protein|nr:hypothetical protein [Clostridiaceae bacterium]
MSRKKCPNCGGKIPETLELCPACMETAGAGSLEIEAAEELRDIAAVLSITAETDGNIKEALQGILNIAERLERRK